MGGIHTRTVISSSKQEAAYIFRLGKKGQQNILSWQKLTTAFQVQEQ